MRRKLITLNPALIRFQHGPLSRSAFPTSPLSTGTGSLRVGAEFLASHYATKVVYIPKPSWPTHRSVFRNAGLQVRRTVSGRD